MIFVLQGLAVGYNTLWVNVVPMLLGNYTKDIFFFYKYKKKKKGKLTI